MHHKRFFTVREANELIPFLTRQLCRLRSACRELRATSEERTPPLQEVMTRGGMLVDPRHLALLCRLQTIVVEICSEGCQIKDLEKGLIDFPTIWEGREIFLCWKLGEPEVRFWHEADAGFAGRRPLKCTQEP